jgi:hypothetical protein
VAALLLRSHFDLPVDETWASLECAAPLLPALIAAEVPAIALVLKAPDRARLRVAMELRQGGVAGDFELGVVADPEGGSSVVWSGRMPLLAEDELEVVLALQTVFRRWARIMARSDNLEPG